ncbi:MAG: GNAT family N-acetyltransferase [Erysipelotrichaceae bacterium]|nr:GNAT family N-acetyltransferase [Erysipelotrichaceae bacterium]MBR3351329.1 GNAT family N-acetyltransferase [Erysipelotrichaceae bacterium]MBR6957904.1 GNAT family N-acetyltransferase [Erysipelotrichaceae bacterium]
MTEVKLIPLTEDDREQFIRDNQRAFKYGATEEFGMRDDHFEEDEEIISRETIERSIDGGDAYRIMADGRKAGGVIVSLEGNKGDLEILFTLPEIHSRGIGQAAWREIEKLYPDVEVWETLTPCFETRNIHFYVNKLGFHIVEYYCKFHPGPDGDQHDEYSEDSLDGMFRFEKRMK